VNNLSRPEQGPNTSRPRHFWDPIFQPHPYLKDVGDRRRAQLVSIFSLGLACLTSLALPATFIARHQMTSAANILIPVIIFFIIAYLLSRSIYYEIGSWILVICMSLSAYGEIMGGASIEGNLLLNISIDLAVRG